MKTRIEVNQEGEPYIILPDDVIEELQIEEGEVVYISVNGGEVILTF